MTKNIIISAGEASGDLHASNLVRHLRALDSELSFTAMGGAHLREADVDVVIDCNELAVIGLIEPLLKIRKIFKVLNQMRELVINTKPDLLILVDYQAFNMKLAKTAKDNGVKVLFYIGPQIWASRPKRVFKLKERVDMMAVLFPFEVPFYETAKVPVKFVGNPLVDEVKTNADKPELFSQYNLDPNRKVIGLLPGSRKGEIDKVLPIQLASAKLLKAKYPDIQFVLAVASSFDKEFLEQQCADYSELNIKCIKDLPYNVISVCDAIITASGTATLEVGIMGVPFAITYKISPISYAILRRIMTVDKIGLVNIVAEKNVIKEFVQQEAVPQNIANEIIQILEDEKYRTTMVKELSLLKAKLGASGGSQAVAKLAYEMLTDETLSSNPSIGLVDKI
jgi:lipid-A-disaccharide synthase